MPTSLVAIESVATVYGVFMSLAPFLQVRRMRQRRSSADVSITYLVVLLVGFVLYFTYGISISNRLLIITNAVSITAAATTVLIAANLRG